MTDHRTGEERVMDAAWGSLRAPREAFAAPVDPDHEGDCPARWGAGDCNEDPSDVDARRRIASVAELRAAGVVIEDPVRIDEDHAPECPARYGVSDCDCAYDAPAGAGDAVEAGRG